MKLKRISLKRLWIPLALILALALPLAILLQDITREIIVVPISYILWIGGLVLKSLPPAFYWILFLFIGVRIAIVSLRPKKRAKESLRPPTPSFPGPVSVWVRRLRLTQLGRYSRWRLAHYLGELSADLLAYEGRLTVGESRERLRDEEIAASPEVRRYLRLGLNPQTLPSRNLLTRLKASLGLDEDSQPSLDLDPEEIVQFLEEQLEVHHDIYPTDTSARDLS